MKNLRVFSHSLIAAVLLLSTAVAVGQNRSKESFKVGDDVLVSVDVTYADVIFETWNKDVVEVEAIVDGKSLSEAEKNEIFENWDLDILGNSKKVVVRSHSHNQWHEWDSMGSLKELKSLESLSGLEALKSLGKLGDMNWNIVVPDIPDYEEFPEWPFSDDRPSVRSGKGYKGYNLHDKGSISFNSEEYKKNKQRYVDKLNKKYDSDASVADVDSWLDDVDDWAEGFESVMEDWGEEFGKEFEMKFGPEFELKMEAWGEEFGKSMEEWGEEFGKEMEKWGEEFGKDIEKWAEQFEDYDDDHGNKRIIIKGDNSSKSKHSKAKKTIIIRMPKGSRTDINVRHGEVKMADAYNIKATLNYATFKANSIDGGKSLINASYAPVSINQWVDGDLNVNYVDDCKINTIRKINLEANSSDVSINSIQDEAFLSGSFGNLFIYNVASSFETIDIVLENTDANIKIPDAAFSFYFSGKKSPFSAPASLEIDKNVNGGRVVLDGYYRSNNSDKKVTINASYSNVNLQK